MSKISLVLEGGGMRGAYTAGALAWLIDNNVEFDYSVGISSGAVHLCSYLLKNKEYLHAVGVDYMSDKNMVGVRPLLREGTYVGYKYVFDHSMKECIKYDVNPLIESKPNMEFGVYDLDQGKTIFFGPEELNNDLLSLQAACTLPIAGNPVKYKNMLLMDGGITTMVPIERAIEKGYDKHIVITTKPYGYVRKPGGAGMNLLMRLAFPRYRCVERDYAVRHINYNKQMAIVDQLVEEGKAISIRPTITIPVKRFSGDPENLQKLYELGYANMEARRDDIMAFMKD